MTNGLSVNDITPLGERPADVWRGRLNAALAGVDSLVGITFGAEISVALGASVNDWAPSGGDTSLTWLVTFAGFTVTGIAADTAGSWHVIKAVNAGTIANESASSTAANRISCPGGTNIALAAGDVVIVEYVATTSRWQVIAGTGGGAGVPVIPAGTYELAIEGGQDVIKAHGTTGATETFDPTDGNVHTATLDANCTVTLSAPTGTGAASLELWLTEDGTGGWTVTWPGSVTEQGSHDTTALTTQRVIVESIDGGTNWIATWVGVGVTSVALTVPAEFSVAGSPITSSGTLAVTKATQSANAVWAGPTSGSAAAPTFRALVAADLPAGVGTTDHEHVMDCLFNGDASTTVWELPAAPFDAYSVAAYVAGVLTEVTLSGAMLTTATFGSAPASGTNNVRFDIVAAVL